VKNGPRKDIATPYCGWGWGSECVPLPRFYFNISRWLCIHQLSAAEDQPLLCWGNT